MKLMTVKQYADSRNLPVSTVRTKCKNGEIPAAKIGVAWRIDPDKADKAIEEMMTAIKVPNTRTVVLKPKKSSSFLERLKAL